MKLELEKAKLYNVFTPIREFKQVVFEGFEDQDDKVAVAVFSDPVSAEFFHFEIGEGKLIVECI
jgi:hypothetical protein